MLCGDEFITKKGSNNVKIPHVVIVEAKKSDGNKKYIEKLLDEGFNYNDKHYVRYGKSGSQGKNGITLFIDESVYEEMYFISQLGLEIESCVVSKYESQRCLTLSTCTLIHQPIPYIVIVDEFIKIIPQQKIRYVEEVTEEIIDRKTGKTKEINVRKIKDGQRDIKLSPFDGCGCHEKNMSELWSSYVGLKDYNAVGYQIRLPLFKGETVEVPFKEIFKSMGVETITDVCGNIHKVEDIDCIWNTSMWKGFGIFKKEFGLKDSWNKYLEAVNRFNYKLGISKYSHHKKDFSLKTRLNYQYIQCLNLWNSKYVEWFSKKPREKYDILNPENHGDLLKLAKETSDLYEKVIKGEKFYSLKFLGIEDTESTELTSKYLEASLINDIMLKDPAIKRFLHCKLKKSIRQAKYGKIYVDGYYHTVVGDMIGYLEYAAGLDPKGCLKAKEFYCETIPKGRALSFRSPLVCPSEVNDINIITNDTTQKWFNHFKDQDMVMINMYDLSMPQQGGIKWRLSSLRETVR